MGQLVCNVNQLSGFLRAHLSFLVFFSIAHFFESDVSEHTEQSACWFVLVAIDCAF